MSDFVYIENHSNKGSLAISRDAFRAVAMEAVNKISGATINKGKNEAKFKLSDSIQVFFRKDGRVELKIAIDLKKGQNAESICKKIEEEVFSSLLAYTECVTFQVNIKVQNLI